jgi:hypothetical protein
LVLYAVARQELPARLAAWQSRIGSNRVRGWAQFIVQPPVIWTALLFAVVTIIVSGATRSMGWGLDSQLDDRLLRLAMGNTKLAGVAWSDDEAAIGMWVWVTEGRVPVYDVPRRALVGGRFSDMKRLGDDLRHLRQFRYLRDDGSESGWWIDLQMRHVSLLLVSANDRKLLRALSPTIWQPLVLDSPVIGCAQAGDQRYQDQLLRTLKEREFVEFGPWQYSWPVSTQSDFDRDRWGLAPIADSRSIARRQAGVFHAIGLPIAALRVLNALRWEEADQDYVRKTLEIHRELAHRENLATGTISPLRMALFHPIRSQPLPNLSDVPRSSAPFQRPSQSMIQVATLYRDGNLSAAVQRLDHPANDDEKLVGALLHWETGRPEQAVEMLRVLQTGGDENPLRRLAKWWLDLVQPADERVGGNRQQDPHGPKGKR